MHWLSWSFTEKGSTRTGKDQLLDQEQLPGSVNWVYHTAHAGPVAFEFWGARLKKTI